MHRLTRLLVNLCPSHRLSRRPERRTAQLQNGRHRSRDYWIEGSIHAQAEACLAAVYRREPPLGLSCDLMIRALANKIQELAYCGPSQSVKRRLNTLAGEFEKGRSSFDPGAALKTGARLVRQWRRHTHSVLVIEGGFGYEGQRYRSLTMIAARITGAHWSPHLTARAVQFRVDLLAFGSPPSLRAAVSCLTRRRVTPFSAPSLYGHRATAVCAGSFRSTAG